MLWLKAFHVVAVITWFAGLFYLPRLFVYHADARDSISIERFKIMERRLYKQILMPAMYATFLFGIMLMLTPGLVDWHHDWFYVKLASVLALAGFHGALGRWRRDFLHDRNTHTQRFFRIANEVPTLLMVLAVVMVVVRPF